MLQASKRKEKNRTQGWCPPSRRGEIFAFIRRKLSDFSPLCLPSLPSDSSSADSVLGIYMPSIQKNVEKVGTLGSSNWIVGQHLYQGAVLAELEPTYCKCYYAPSVSVYPSVCVGLRFCGWRSKNTGVYGSVFHLPLSPGFGLQEPN